MKVLLDTNVILDVILNREPFFENSRRVVELCSSKKCYGFLAAHSVTNLFFILRKNFSSADRRRTILNLLTFLKVTQIGIEKLAMALLNEKFKDFEDCLQAECAAAAEVDYIITRDVKDFEASKIPCITPAEFCAMFK